MTATTANTGAARTADLDVVPLSGSIGAVIRGLDLRRVDDATVGAIRQVWLDRRVVFFPEQDLTPEEHLAFAVRFGEPTEGHPVIPGPADHPDVFEIDYTRAARVLEAANGGMPNRGVTWH